MFKFLKAPRKKRPPLSDTRRGKYQGVSVKTNAKYMCEAAFCIEGTRFLAHEAPSLPVHGCADIQKCRCVYKHFYDRRTGVVRRDSDDGLPLKDYPNPVRQGWGRRMTDG